MQQTTPNVNTGIAPLTNVALCLGTLKRAINRPRHLPGITVFYGPSGFGKSTAAACAVIQCRACYVQARSSWTRKAAHEAICKGLGLKRIGTKRPCPSIRLSPCARAAETRRDRTG